MERRAVVINYRNMAVGGIENYAYQIMKHAMKEDFDVIWFSDPTPIVSSIYDDVLNSKKLTIVKCDTHKFNWFKHKKLSLNNYERIVLLSFSFFDHLRILELIKKEKLRNAVPFLITPHFTGGLIFPEQNFKILRKVIRKNVGKEYFRWVNSGEMLFLAQNHIDAIENAYNFVIDDNLKRMAPEYVERREFIENEVLEKFSQKPFRIVSAGRFEFPHKGYVLGLIDAVAKIIDEKEDIELVIVGDGRDREQVEEKIKSLNPVAKPRVKLLPMMPVKNLLDLYQSCNLSISVAGCASMGARIGLLTLPARHYTNACEVYGFFPDSKNMTTSTKPGYDVIPFIKRVLNMNAKEYLNLSRAAYDSFDDKKISINDFIDMNKEYFPYIPSKKVIRKFKIIYYLDKIVFYINKLEGKKNE